MTRRTHIGDRVLTIELASKRPDHRYVHARGRRRRRSSSPPAFQCQVSGVGRDHVGIEVPDHGWPAELLAPPVPERAVDRRVLPPRPRGRSPGGDPIGLP